MTVNDIYNTGEALNLSPREFRALLSMRMDSLERMQKAFIRVGLPPNHTVRTALAERPLAMFQVYKKFFDIKRQLLAIIRAGGGEKLDQIKADSDSGLFPSTEQVPTLTTSRPGTAFDVDDLFESVRPGDVRTIPGEWIDRSKLEVADSLGFSCPYCKIEVRGGAEASDYRRVAFCECVGAIYAPPYSSGPTQEEWAILVPNTLRLFEELRKND
jgi:hypothetical protein